MPPRNVERVTVRPGAAAAVLLLALACAARADALSWPLSAFANDTLQDFSVADIGDNRDEVGWVVRPCGLATALHTHHSLHSADCNAGVAPAQQPSERCSCWRDLFTCHYHALDAQPVSPLCHATSQCNASSMPKGRPLMLR